MRSSRIALKALRSSSMTSLAGCRAVPSMTPGLAFFEAGLLRSRNSISILMQCWAGLCILSVLWYALPPSADQRLRRWS